MFKQHLSNHLPPHLRDALVRAAAIEPQIAVGFSIARTRALDSTIAHLKSKYPQFFKQSETPSFYRSN